MPEWAAEVVVDEQLARRLIGAQFPELEVESLRLLAEGWDNAVWLVDERWAFRFPRRTISLPGVERELAVLPLLGPLVPVAIPVPVFLGAPSDDYPWPFFGSRLIPGRELPEATLDDEARVRLARPLGAFLRVLHSEATRDAVAAQHALPVDPMGRTDMARRVPRTIERLAEMRRLGLAPLPPAVDDLLEAARAVPPPQGTSVVHGDLHVRHLLVDEAGSLSGVIDWGDLCLANPASDLHVIWTVLPADGRGAFMDAYGPVTEAQLVCARVLAVFLSAVLAVYGRAEGLPGLEREAVAGLARAASD